MEKFRSIDEIMYGYSILFFWIPWCGPCDVLEPILDNISLDYENKIKFYKINVDENTELGLKYNVKGFPTTIFLKNGIEEARLLGLVSSSDIEKRLKQILS